MDVQLIGLKTVWMTCHGLGVERLESFPAEKDLGVLVTAAEHEPGCAQGAKKGNGILAWISNGVASRSRAGIVPLCWAHLECCVRFCVQCWAPHSKKDIEVLMCVQNRAMELLRGLENKSHHWEDYGLV
ncbi:hypothetical protein DUI87_18931 [Hirundo rustica rustica]|uniref:Uncharacterized protein n=1 Tax=Hirundo rustica rustica TaxID=333673 RepID=A0A3M0JTZ6_HIRRU|nr:hypothetical protein DUI87_18931 [Hirundo rustica rustica]